MAWEEESVDTNLDLEEVGGKKFPLKLILIVIAGLVVLGGGGFLIWKLLLSGDSAEPTDEPEKAEARTEAPAETPEVGYKVDLEKFTVNLADPDETRFLVIKIALEVSTEQLVADIHSENDDMLYLVKTRDLILKVLRSKTSSEFSDAGNLEEIRREIIFGLNSIYKSGEVMQLYIVDMVIQ